MKTIRNACLTISGGISYGVLKLMTEFLGLFFSDPERIVMTMICKGMKDKKHYVQFRLVPKNSLDIPVVDLNNEEQLLDGRFAIVMQGPIPKDMQFLIDSIRFYQRVYKQSTIIVSTWDDEEEERVNAVKKTGVVFLQTAKPQKSGINNVNYQLVNSLAGIMRAKELGCEYVVKTRTDQRICKTYLFYNMRTMQEKIPPCPSSHQRKRIAVLTYCNMFIPYFICDFLYCGQIDDLLELFSAPLDDRQPFQMKASAPRREYIQTMYPPEIYIIKNYLRNYLNYDCRDDVKSHWDVLKKYFICYSIKEADVLWPKYGAQYEINRRYGEYFGNRDSETTVNTMNFDFFNWYDLYCGTLNYKEEFEKYVDAPWPK